jgi:protein phosphatase 1 regulatory subunit 11
MWLIMKGLEGRKVKVGFSCDEGEKRMLMQRIVCCIYHALKPIDESSDESSSDSDNSDSDSGDDGSARPARRVGGGGGHGHNNGHNHDHDHGHGHDHGKPAKKDKGRARSPNAYEKQPKAKSRGTEKS